ncbi:hypothetical protein ANN_23743 [Periplaneta americana]|uniref:Uncharacterized protein n=1 Tax=Periplaneta americana TaxID=6978 RepID=A0ABQ8SN96_PERAM|nr:hypothetical protein ANN_23743 [Periplaneta americana]
MAGLCEGGNEPPCSLKAISIWCRKRHCDNTPLAGQRQIQMERSLTPVSERVGVGEGRKQEKCAAIIASHNVLVSHIFVTAVLKEDCFADLELAASLPTAFTCLSHRTANKRVFSIPPALWNDNVRFSVQAYAFRHFFFVLFCDQIDRISHSLRMCQVNKETGCSSISGTSTNDGPVKQKLQGRRKTTVPVSDYESDEIELNTDHDVSGVLSIFTDNESDVEKKTKSVKLMLKAHSYMVVTYEEELWPGKVLEVKNNGAVVSCIIMSRSKSGVKRTPIDTDALKKAVEAIMAPPRNKISIRKTCKYDKYIFK